MDQGMEIAAPSCHHEQAIQEIARGCEFLALLQDLLLPTTPSDHRSEHPASLIKEALQAFTAALSLLQACRRPQSCSHPASAQVQVGTTCANNRTSKYSDKKRKISERGDENSGHRRRSYYRCTNRVDQGCQATKRVQQMDEADPPKYTVTYINQHICKTMESSPPIVVNSTTRNSPVLDAEDNSLKSLAAQDKNNGSMVLLELPELEIETSAAYKPDVGVVISNEFSHASLFSLDAEWMNNDFGWIA